MKKKIKISVYLILNFLFIYNAFLVWQVYTSFFENSPWYEPSGMQFILYYVVNAPISLFIGISMFFLGKTIDIPKSNKIIPFMFFGFILYLEKINLFTYNIRVVSLTIILLLLILNTAYNTYLVVRNSKS